MFAELGISNVKDFATSRLLACRMSRVGCVGRCPTFFKPFIILQGSVAMLNDEVGEGALTGPKCINNICK